MTPEKGIPYQRHKPSAALRAFLDPLDPGAYFDCGRARLRGLDDALLREARSRGRTIGDDSFQLVATDMGVVYCRPSISFAIAARWDQISLGEPHGEDPVVLSIRWPTHGELNFTVSSRLAGNIYRRWVQLRPEQGPRKNVVPEHDRPEPKGPASKSGHKEQESPAEPPVSLWPEFVEPVTAESRQGKPDWSDWEIVDRLGSSKGRPRVVQGNEVAKPDRRQAAKALRRERQRKAASRKARISPSQTAETWNPAAHPSDLTPIRHEYAPDDPDAVPGDGPLLRAAAHAAALAAKLELEEGVAEETALLHEAAEPDVEAEPRVEAEPEDETETELDVRSGLEPEVETQPEDAVMLAVEPLDPAIVLVPAEAEVEHQPDPEVEADFQSGARVEHIAEAAAEVEPPSDPEPTTAPAQDPLPPDEPVQPDLPPGFRYVVPPAGPAPAAPPPSPPAAPAAPPAAPAPPRPPTPPAPAPPLAVAMGAAAKVREEGVAAVTGDHPATEPAREIGPDQGRSVNSRSGRPRTRAAHGEPSWVGSPASLVGATVAVSSLVLIATLAVASYRRTSEVAADVNPAGPAVSIINHQRFLPSARTGSGVGFGALSTLERSAGQSGSEASPSPFQTPQENEGPVDPTSTTGSGTAPVSSIPVWSEPDGPRTCNSNYSGCVPDVGDVDCPDDGDGPIYWPESAVVMGEDVYELDTDGDGEICEPDQPRLDQLADAEG